MKKYFIIIACAVIVAFMVALFSGCSSSSAISNVSDDRYGVFDGECENFNATLIYGKRETPYKLDGIANELVDFAIISVNFPNKIAENEVVTYSLTAGDKKSSGNLERNPYTNEYMVDTKLALSGDETVNLVVQSDSCEETSLSLTNRSKTWEIDHEKALELGAKSLKEEINAFKKNGGYEIQIKIATQQKTNFGTYYWNFYVISTSGKRHSVLISVSNGEILVKNWI